ncbi:MAG: DoxX family protein [Acidimicrobiales bacterium]
MLAGLLAGSGTAHLVVPRFYDAIVPRGLPGPARAWTLVSGVAELMVAGALAHPATRRLGAVASVALLVAVFPANVQMAQDAQDASTARKILVFGRLPLQLPLIALAISIYRRESQAAAG